MEIKEEKERDEKLLLLQTKCKVFMELEQEIYVRTKSEEWFKGLVKWVGADFFVIRDRKLGDWSIFYLEVEKLEQNREVNKEEKKDGKPE